MGAGVKLRHNLRLLRKYLEGRAGGSLAPSPKRLFATISICWGPHFPPTNSTRFGQSSQRLFPREGILI